MADTYSQINIHCIFAVKGRENLLTKQFDERLYKYISGILRKDGSFPLAVGGWTDHVHIFFELKPAMSVADQVRMVKATSSKWINDNKLVKGKFEWQKGYAAFSYSKTQRPDVISYIQNQDQHHKVKSFREEYIDFLRKFDVSFEERYLFDFYE